MTREHGELHSKVSKAVAYFWRTRQNQVKRQQQTGTRDQGSRGAVTGGAQMNGFISLISEIIESAGIEKKHIFYKKALEIPGYFRPTNNYCYGSKVSGWPFFWKQL